MTIVLYCILALVISTMFTMIGLGGGLVYSPLFIISGIPVPLAVSTSLIMNGLAALSAAVAYMQKKMVQFNIAIPLVIACTLGAHLGAHFFSHVNVKLIIGLLTLTMIFGAYLMAFASVKVDEDRREEPRMVRKIIAGAMFGFLIGILAGMLGIGGGVFAVPLFIYVMGVPTRIAVATSTLISASASISGFVTHITLGNYELGFTVPMAVAVIIGGQVGSRIMIRKLPAKTIRRMFAVVLILMSIKMIHELVAGWH